MVLKDKRGRIVKVFERVPRWDDELGCYTTLSEREVQDCRGAGFKPRQRQETRRVLSPLTPEEWALRESQLQPQALRETLASKFKVTSR